METLSLSIAMGLGLNLYNDIKEFREQPDTQAARMTYDLKLKRLGYFSAAVAWERASNQTPRSPLGCIGISDELITSAAALHNPWILIALSQADGQSCSELFDIAFEPWTKANAQQIETAVISFPRYYKMTTSSFERGRGIRRRPAQKPSDTEDRDPKSRTQCSSIISNDSKDSCAGDLCDIHHGSNVSEFSFGKYMHSMSDGGSIRAPSKRVVQASA